MGIFRRLNLEKFYLDVVSADGSGCIGYATRLDAGLMFEPAAMLVWDASDITRPIQARTLRGAAPRCDGGTWSWRCPALAIDGVWQRRAAPVGETLWRDGGGSVQWDNLAPRAAVTMRAGGRSFTGWGYVERLRIDVAPWLLPIAGLRWGRFVTPETSVVWIAWEHAEPRAWLWHDGHRCEVASITEHAVEWRGGRVSFAAHRVLRQGRLGETVFARWPQARRLLPERLRAYEETKWCSPAALSVGGRAACNGWAIHEFVRIQ